jgi:hypothetical protein
VDAVVANFLGVSYLVHKSLFHANARPFLRSASASASTSASRLPIPAFPLPPSHFSLPPRESRLPASDFRLPTSHSRLGSGSEGVFGTRRLPGNFNKIIL